MLLLRTPKFNVNVQYFFILFPRHGLTLDTDFSDDSERSRPCCSSSVDRIWTIRRRMLSQIRTENSVSSRRRIGNTDRPHWHCTCSSLSEGSPQRSVHQYYRHYCDRCSIKALSIWGNYLRASIAILKQTDPIIIADRVSSTVDSFQFESSGKNLHGWINTSGFSMRSIWRCKLVWKRGLRYVRCLLFKSSGFTTNSDRLRIRRSSFAKRLSTQRISRSNSLILIILVFLKFWLFRFFERWK